MSAENDNLRLLLEQAGIDGEVLLAQARTDIKEREAADKLQKLILGELRHRIKNTSAPLHRKIFEPLRLSSRDSKLWEGRLLALGRPMILLMQISWSNASLTHTFGDATEPFETEGTKRFRLNGPDIRITSAAVVALGMTF